MIKGLYDLAEYWEEDSQEQRQINEAIAEIERLRKENLDMRIKVEVTDESAESIIAENERLQTEIGTLERVIKNGSSSSCQRCDEVTYVGAGMYI